MLDLLSRVWFHLRSTFVFCVRHSAVIGGLPRCKDRHFRDATKETVIRFILSTSPLWLGSLIVFGVDTGEGKTFSGYLKVLVASFSKGELLIFATSAVAPIFFFALTPPKYTRDFPGRLSHVVCGLLVFMICTALFGAQRS